MPLDPIVRESQPLDGFDGTVSVVRHSRSHANDSLCEDRCGLIGPFAARP